MTQQPSDNIFVGDLPPHLTTQDAEGIFAGYGTVVQCRVMEPRNAGGKASALVRFSSVAEAQWVVDNLNGNLAEGLEEPIVVRFANAPGGKAGKDGGKGGYDKGYGKGGGYDNGKGGYGKDSWGGKGGGAAKGPYDKGAGKGSWGKSDDWGGKGGKGDGKGKKGGNARSLLAAVKGAGLLGGGLVPNECQVYCNNLPKDMQDVDLFKLFAPFGALSPTGCKAMLHEDGSCKGFGFADFANATSAQSAADTLNNFALPDGTPLGVSIKVSGGAGKGGKGKGPEA